MNRIEADCSRCGTRLSVPAPAVLLDARPAISRGWLVCGTCRDIVGVAVPKLAVVGLLARGCHSLDAPSAVPHPEIRSPGPAFDADDVLALHALLQDDAELEAALIRLAVIDDQL